MTTSTGHFEVGLHLANAHPTATVLDVVELALAAEAAGFAAVYITEHVVVASDLAERYGTVVHPLPTLSFLAARTSSVQLATSVIVAPLHDPFLLAKLAADLQALSGGRLRLGVGAGWYEPEFGYLRRDFASRGRRLDEQVALMRALWRGDHHHDGEHWRVDDAHLGPLPETAPEIWIGGKSARAAARAARLDATWHPIELTADDIAAARRRHPALRIVPRVTAATVGALAADIDRMRSAGADGVAAGLSTGPAQTRAALAELAQATL